MSDSNKQPNYARMWFVVYNVLLLMGLVFALGFVVHGKLTDLQLRVGTLEQRCK